MEPTLVLRTQISEVLDIEEFPTFINEHYPSFCLEHQHLVRNAPDNRSAFMRASFPIIFDAARLPPTEERLFITIKLSDLNRLINVYDSVEKVDNVFNYKKKLSPQPRPEITDDNSDASEEDTDNDDSEEDDDEPRPPGVHSLNSIIFEPELNRFNQISNTFNVTYLAPDNIDDNPDCIDLDPMNITAINLNNTHQASDLEVAVLSTGRLPLKNVKNWPKIKKDDNLFKKSRKIKLKDKLKRNRPLDTTPIQNISPIAIDTEDKFEDYQFIEVSNEQWASRYPSLRPIIIEFDKKELVFSCTTRHNKDTGGKLYINKLQKLVGYKEYYRKKKKYEKISTSSKAMKNFIKINRFILSTRFYKFNSFMVSLGFEGFLQNFYSFDKLRNFLLLRLRDVQQNITFIKSSFIFKGSFKNSMKLKNTLRHKLSNDFIKGSKYIINFKETKQYNHFKFYINIRFNYDTLTSCIKKSDSYTHIEYNRSLNCIKNFYSRQKFKHNLDNFKFTVS